MIKTFLKDDFFPLLINNIYPKSKIIDNGNIRIILNVLRRSYLEYYDHVDPVYLYDVIVWLIIKKGNDIETGIYIYYDGSYFEIKDISYFIRKDKKSYISVSLQEDDDIYSCFGLNDINDFKKLLDMELIMFHLI